MATYIENKDELCYYDSLSIAQFIKDMNDKREEERAENDNKEQDEKKMLE